MSGFYEEDEPVEKLVRDFDESPRRGVTAPPPEDQAVVIDRLLAMHAKATGIAQADLETGTPEQKATAQAILDALSGKESAAPEPVKHELVMMFATQWDAAGQHPPTKWLWLCSCGRRMVNIPEQIAAIDSFSDHKRAGESSDG